MSELATRPAPGDIPLSPTESRAGLEAVGRVLGVAREQTRHAAPHELADILESAGQLPTLLAEPAVFRDRFRPTLLHLARRHPEFVPVLSEFDNQTSTRRRRRTTPADELWIDCGEGD